MEKCTVASDDHRLYNMLILNTFALCYVKIVHLTKLLYIYTNLLHYGLLEQVTIMDNVLHCFLSNFIFSTAMIFVCINMDLFQETKQSFLSTKLCVTLPFKCTLFIFCYFRGVNNI